MAEEFVWAIKNGDMSQIKDIMEKGSVDLDKEILNGRLPLHFAADYGQTEVLSYLLSKGADINRPDKHGITPLLAAVFESHASCVKLLVEKGADMTGKAPNGESYIECAESDEIKNLLK